MTSQIRTDLTVLIPLYNEEDSIEELHERIKQSLAPLEKTYEILLIDDGSTDRGPQILASIHERDPHHVRVLQFRRNFGKAAGLQAGFRSARGQVVITMDADLQDDPKEIPRFLEKLEEGFDLVSGWKQKRFDPLGKRLPSKLFNAVTRKVSGIRLHDFNCGFKAYRREVIEEVSLYGELHRYLPVLAGWRGFRIGEIVVEHHPRKHGVSKYGVERLTRGLFDLVTIYYTRKYAKSPLHAIGKLGFSLSFFGFGILVYLAILWFSGQTIGHRPLLTLGVLLVLFGMQVISIGVVNEMIAKLDHRFEKGYSVRKELDTTVTAEMKEDKKDPNGSKSNSDAQDESANVYDQSADPHSTRE